MGLFGKADAPTQPTQDTMTAYQPTLRDKLATGLLGMIGDGYEQRKFVGNLVGSTGLGHSKDVLSDYIGLTLPLQGDEAGRQMASGHPLVGAANMALAALPVPAVAKGGVKAAGRALEKVAARTVEKKAPIVAYHGSPHAFDQFSTDGIGTGEGAQAYGHGLYFAENEATAQAYRKGLSGARPDFDGKIAPALRDELDSIDWLGFDGPGEALTGIRRHADWADRWDVPPEQASRMAPLIEAHEARKYQGQGHMYQVGIHADPEHFLDWDKPVAEQTGLPDLLRAGVSSHETGEDFYRMLGGKQEAASTLHALGVPGIKYLDQGSRGVGDGTRNYVVFNAKLIDIMKRYGVAAPVAATMLASGQFGDPHSHD